MRKHLTTYSLVSLAFFFITGSSRLVAQQLIPPVITCVELDNSGNATVHWTPVSDPNGYFTYYEIRSSSNTGGPFTTVGNANNLSDDSFTYNTGVNPPTAPTYFQLFTGSTDGTLNYLSDPSSVVGTIFLTAAASTNPLGFASLNWNSPYPVNTPAPSGIQYEVWVQKAGNWAMVQTLPFGVTNWSYEIMEMCDELLQFQIKLSIPSGCTFSSNTPSGIFRDLISPDIPVISSVSIDHASADAIIHWEPSLALDTKGYLIYKCQGNDPPVTTLIGTVMGHLNTEFIDMVSNTNISAVQYAIAAFDSCYLLTPPMVPASPIGDCNRSIFLDSPSYTNCNDYIKIKWDHYYGWEFGIDSYTIYHGYSAQLPGPGNPVVFTPIATVSGNVTNYTHHGIPHQDGYNSYYIEGHASQTGYTAISNMQSVMVHYPSSPDLIYLGSASVLNDDSTQIVVDMTPASFAHEFILQRYGLNSHEWRDILNQSAQSTPQVIFTDEGLSNDVFSYTYRVVVKNGCGAFVDTTNLGVTILADGIANTDLFINSISWSKYGEWDNGVNFYRIYREIDDSGEEELIGHVNGTSNLYFEDNVSNLLYTKGKFCYRVEAVEAPPFPSGAEHTARSNEICLNQEPVIWIPNSFIVGGANNTFGPVISFADFDSYRMTIFSRWGDIVYDTTDITAPWDGKFNEKTAQQGSYIYFITIKDGFGRAIEKRGYVNLIVRKGLQ